jgi:hypothetical protein
MGAVEGSKCTLRLEAKFAGLDLFLDFGSIEVVSFC